MVVINPPYTLRATMAEALPVLASRLAGNGGDWSATQWVAE
jgi:23S rRNA A2030 N6-methylase RlmJ